MFHNLFPEDVPNPIRVAILKREKDKWIEATDHGIRSASGLYNFVVIDSIIYVSKANRVFHGMPVGHLEIAQGRPVAYAGQIQFAGRKKRGLLRFWDNSSGHYQPSADAAGQAGLPLELFRSGHFG